MALLNCTYGKGRVRVMRVKRDGPQQEVRELDIQTMLTGGFDGAFVAKDNSAAISTDTVKNLINIVARENLGLDKEAFGLAVIARFFERYPQVETVTFTGHETKWVRLAFAGKPHPHSFVLDGNGRPFTRIAAGCDGAKVTSGIAGFTFMKSTESGWAGYEMDSYTTLPETRDRLCATALDVSWDWTVAPADYGTANTLILDTMLEVFATTYSDSVQDTLYRMGMAALDAVPEIEQISLAAPNKHYIPINLSPFGISGDNTVFTPTDEPHGQIECVVGRD